MKRLRVVRRALAVGGSLELHARAIETTPSHKRAHDVALLVPDLGLVVHEKALQSLVANTTHRHQGTRDLRDLKRGVQQARCAVDVGLKVQVNLALVRYERPIADDEVLLPLAAG